MARTSMDEGLAPTGAIAGWRPNLADSPSREGVMDGPSILIVIVILILIEKMEKRRKAAPTT